MKSLSIMSSSTVKFKTLARIMSACCNRSINFCSHHQICRSFLSKSYVCPKLSEQIISGSPGCDDMSSQSLALNRCHERNLPVSSMMIDRMIRSVKTDQHLTGSLYYFFKFRHTQNSYYLKPWTIHTFVMKCLEVNHAILLEILHQKTQYGIFPEWFSMNLALDSFLKKEDLKGAISITCQLFLLELLDNKVSQTLAIQAISQFWKQNVQDDNVIPHFEDLEFKRNIAGILYCIGIHSANPSLTLIGQSLLGSIETEHGVRSLYQDPWGPLSWKSGYLQRALNSIEILDETISEQSMKIFLECLPDGDTDLLDQVEKARDKAAKRNLISNDQQWTLDGIAKSVLSDLDQYENEDKTKSRKEMSLWLEDRTVLENIERDLLRDYKDERESFFRNIKMTEEAHKRAIESLGYWDMAKSPEDVQVAEKPVFYLQEDYIEGALYDLELVERFRKRKSIVIDPVILIS